MNRSIIYTQEQPRTFDVLWGWRDALIAAGYLQQDLAGNTTTVVSGFVAVPSSPASLVLNLAAGRIYEQASTDTTQYGSIPSDAELIMQQGMAAAQSVTLSTAALSAGQNQWALIEVSFAQVDVIRANDPTGGVLYYWNSANPTVPFQGPNGDGQTQPTEREGVASIQVIYGAPAVTGSEVPPTPSAGAVPLYLVDLTFGQTTIVSNQIIVAGQAVGANVPGNYPYAPFLAGLLASHHSGHPGQAPQIKMAELANVSSANTGAGLASMYSYAGNPNGHVAGVAAVTGVSAADLCIDVTNNLLYFCSTTGNAAAAVWNPTTGQSSAFAGSVSTGTANAQVVGSVAPGGFALVAGYSVTFTPGVTNTGATNLQVLATTNTACRKVSGGNLVAFTGAEFTINIPVTVVYNGTFWVLQTGALGALATLNIGAFLKNDGSGNLAVNNGLGLASDGTGALTVAAGGVTPAMLSAAGAPLPYVAALGAQGGGNLTISNDVTNPNYEVDIAVGRVRDDSDATNIQIAAALVKRLDQSWAAGTGNGACDTSTKGINQTWHAFLIGKLAMVPTAYARTSNVASLTVAAHGLGVGSTVRVYGHGLGFDGLQVVTAVTTNTFNYSNAGSNVSGTPPATALCDGFDSLFSQSYASPTMPSGWTVKQCLGSVLTDGSANILQFRQIGDKFLWVTPILDVNGIVLSGPISEAVRVPLGVIVLGAFQGFSDGGANTANLRISSPDYPDVTVQSDSSASFSATAVGVSGVRSGSTVTDVPTNSSAQIRLNGSASYTVSVTTLGWRDPRRRLF